MADREAFEAAIDEHRRLLFKVASVYTHTVEDRRDLGQEITLQLWRAFPAFDATRAKLSTWMYRIALNVAISHLRRARWSEADRVELDAIPARQVEPDDDQLAALNAVIARFDPMDRALILLYLEDRSYSEIADVLGLSESNVGTKLNRIKHALRARLGA
ncbi:MAG: sigma-70 family RNA polymerase sigma factor [Kofleriaceae bacterium]